MKIVSWTNLYYNNLDIHKTKWFPPSMLTFGPKCSFLGYTIFQIWQGYYSRKTFNPLCFCHTGSWNSSQWSRDNLIDRLFLLLEFPFSKKFVHTCTLKHFLRKRKISFWCFKYQKIIIREFSPNANFITANFVTTVFQNFPDIFCYCDSKYILLMRFFN